MVTTKDLRIAAGAVRRLSRNEDETLDDWEVDGLRGLADRLAAGADLDDEGTGADPDAVRSHLSEAAFWLDQIDRDRVPSGQNGQPTTYHRSQIP